MFYTFPGSCAVQVLAGFSDGVKIPQELTQKHRLTLAVVYDGQIETELKALGFQKIGTFNKAHSGKGKLALWAAGSEFEIFKEKKDGDIEKDSGK